MRPISKIHPRELDGLQPDEIIDVRSPSEFDEDHLPGAINLPVLDDEQRAEVGTIYKQRSAFEARRLGAGLVSENIARHIRDHFADKPAEYRPVVYCWRGGDRSGSMATILDSIGWRPTLLDGGYRAFRKYVVAELAEMVGRPLKVRIVAGLTGAGKTWLLKRLEAAGAQVVDLEGLAEHRGSALGESTTKPQPSQKAFETRLFQQLKTLDPSRTTYIESESSRIGVLQVPSVLWSLMRESVVIELEVPRIARARYLVEDYRHFVEDRPLLEEKLGKVRHLQPKERFEEWEGYLERGEWLPFVESLLEHHYDPAYLRSRQKTFRPIERCYPFAAVTEEELDRVAAEIMEHERE